MARSIATDGTKVTKARTRAGLTVDALADVARISKTTVEAAQRGEPIGMDSLKRLAKALEVKPAALLPGESHSEGSEAPMVIKVFVGDAELAVVKIYAPYIERVLTVALEAIQEVKVRGVHTGSVIMDLELSHIDAPYLVEMLPYFNELMARTVYQLYLSNPYEKGDKQKQNPDGIDFAVLSKLLLSITELRFPKPAQRSLSVGAIS